MCIAVMEAVKIQKTHQEAIFLQWHGMADTSWSGKGEVEEGF
jgi:hypothetical protein